MSLWRKWFPPKWKFHQVKLIRKSTGPNWIGQAIVIRDGEERLVQKFWKRQPTPGEVKAFAKAEAKRRNTGGEKHAFNLRQKGLVVATVHGAWIDDDNFEIAEIIHRDSSHSELGNQSPSIPLEGAMVTLEKK